MVEFKDYICLIFYWIFINAISYFVQHFSYNNLSMSNNFKIMQEVLTLKHVIYYFLYFFVFVFF